MNVAFEPWIPVVDASGNRVLASLCSVLTEGEKYVDLAVRPHERVALMRLFLCVAHAALDGPKKYDDWLEVPNHLPEAVKKYLEHWKDSFELFHKDKPWLQVAKLNLIQPEKEDDSNDEEKGWTPLSRLCFTRASGINSTLFDHESNGADLTKYSDAEIALNLLTFQNFFVAGGKASSRLWDTFEMKSPPNPKGGPCSGKSILYTFLRGSHVYESICLNLNTYEDLKFIYGDSKDFIGNPLWELPIKSPSDYKAIINATQTHIGRLVPQTRILRINEDRKRLLLGAGFIYPKYQDKKNTFQPDIFATMVLNKKNERELLSVRPNIAIWRELHTLAVRRKDSSSSNRGPLCLLNIPDNKSCDITVNAMMTNPKQPAEIVDLVESVFSIPAALMSSTGSVAYEMEVNKAESVAWRLGEAIEEYRKGIDDYWERRVKQAKSKAELRAMLHSIATLHYWTTAEKNLPLLMSHINAIGSANSEPTLKVWRAMLYNVAREAYRLACGQETPRQMRAFVKGWEKLTMTKDKPDTDQDKEEKV